MNLIEKLEHVRHVLIKGGYVSEGNVVLYAAAELDYLKRKIDAITTLVDRQDFEPKED